MLNWIRNINQAWILILVGIILIFSGLKITNEPSLERTLLCFDNNCIYIQGISNIVIGCLTIVIGLIVLYKSTLK